MEYDRVAAENKLLSTIVKKDDPGPCLIRKENNSPLRKDGSPGAEELGSTCGTKVRYEPHTIKAEMRKDRKGKKEFHIRGVFRMDPRFDP